MFLHGCWQGLVYGVIIVAMMESMQQTAPSPVPAPALRAWNSLTGGTFTALVALECGPQ
jgi:hypothetical protein